MDTIKIEPGTADVQICTDCSAINQKYQQGLEENDYLKAENKYLKFKLENTTGRLSEDFKLHLSNELAREEKLSILIHEIKEVVLLSELKALIVKCRDSSIPEHSGPNKRITELIQENQRLKNTMVSPLSLFGKQSQAPTSSSLFGSAPTLFGQQSQVPTNVVAHQYPVSSTYNHI